MFVKYHLFYYALGCFFFSLGKYFHPLFYLFFIFYLIYVFFRLERIHIFVVLGLCFLMNLYSYNQPTLPSIVEGRVIKVSSQYCLIKTKYGKVKLYHQEKFSYNDSIKVKVKPLEIKKATNDNAFNEQNYLRGQNIRSKAQVIEVISHISHPCFYHVLEKQLAKDETLSSYQRLLLLGERDENMEEDYQMFSSFSLVHLFALSGMHLNLIYSLLNQILGLFFDKKKSHFFSLCLIGFYLYQIPFQISLFRAFFLLVTKDYFSHFFHELDLLSLLCCFLFVYNPYILYSTSFIFSFFISYLILFTKNLPHQSLLISLGLFPLLVNSQSRYSFLTLITLPLWEMAMKYLYGFCWLSLFVNKPFFIGIQLFKNGLSLLMKYQVFLHFSKPNLLFYLAFYSFYLLLIIRYSLKKSIKIQGSALLALLLVFSFYSEYKIYGEITMIDVGQGDCTLVRLPFNQGNILIDTGGSMQYDYATKTIIPYFYSIGVHYLDYVIISHDDLDHCGALESLKENFNIKHIITKVQSPINLNNATITFLTTDQVYDNDNDRSLIVKMDLPMGSVLFTGDISSIVEEDLYRKYGKMNIDILKVSHHGSQSGTSATLFEMISPSIAMIGVKKNNMYHHPSNEVIERLKRKQVTILRTDNDGMFHVRFYGKDRYIFK